MAPWLSRWLRRRRLSVAPPPLPPPSCPCCLRRLPLCLPSAEQRASKTPSVVPTHAHVRRGTFAVECGGGLRCEGKRRHCHRNRGTRTLPLPHSRATARGCDKGGVERPAISAHQRQTPPLLLHTLYGPIHGPVVASHAAKHTPLRQAFRSYLKVFQKNSFWPTAFACGRQKCSQRGNVHRRGVDSALWLSLDHP